MQIMYFPVSLILVCFPVAQSVYIDISVQQTLDVFTPEAEFLTVLTRNGKVVKRSVLEVDPKRTSTPAFDINFAGQKKRRVKRADGSATPENGGANTTAPVTELRPDEIAADPSKFPVAGGDSSYPAMITPNVTCVTADDMKLRIQSLSDFKNTRKCPKKFPCQQQTSCMLWRTNFVTKALAVDMERANDYYTQLFLGLHDQKLEELKANFKECVEYYGLDQPFVGEVDENAATEEPSAIGHTHEHAKKKKKSRKHKGSRRKRDAPPAAETTAAPTAAAPGDTAADADAEIPDQKAGLTDCRIRIDDYLECLDTIMIKGLCYWPPVQLA